MKNLQISIIQADLVWENKSANLKQLEEKILQLPYTEIVVLPEMFSTGFSMRSKDLAETMEGETVQWMRTIAKQKKIILTGSLIIEKEGRYFNRLIWMLPNGELGYYDKRHLFGYAGEHQHYSSGNKRLIASVKGWKINLIICYDLRFPVWMRQQKDTEGSFENVHSEYDLLICVANWPEKRVNAWRTLLMARAIENQCYVVAVNRVGNDGNGNYHSGNSMVINPLGEIVFEKAHETFEHTLQLNGSLLSEIRTSLPFLKDADQFLIL
jgi:predicted amidohydrolase